MNSRNRKLPPLVALRAFEAGARLGSFTLAAKELHVTQTAISHQIRALENFYEQPLFVRRGREIELTSAGKKLSRASTQWLDQIHDLSHQLIHQRQRQKPLRITTAPVLGSRWLAPRLATLWAQHNIELNLIPSGELLDFRRDDIDFGLRTGLGDWPDVVAEYLMPLNEIPVCAPSLLGNKPPLKTPEDLAYFLLIHEFNYRGWQTWFRDQHAEQVPFERGTLCQDPRLTIELAVGGQGVALINGVMIRDELKSGALIAPLGKNSQKNTAYYLTYLEHTLDNPQAKIFRDFICQQAKADREKDGF